MMRKLVIVLVMLCLMMPTFLEASYWAAKVDPKDGHIDIMVDIMSTRFIKRYVHQVAWCAEGERKWVISPQDWVLIVQRARDLPVIQKSSARYVPVRFTSLARTFFKTEKAAVQTTMDGLYWEFVEYLRSRGGSIEDIGRAEIYIIGYEAGRPMVFRSEDQSTQEFDFAERHGYMNAIKGRLNKEVTSNEEYLADFMAKMLEKKKQEGREDPSRWFFMYCVSSTFDHLQCSQKGCVVKTVYSLDPADPEFDTVLEERYRTIKSLHKDYDGPINPDPPEETLGR